MPRPLLQYLPFPLSHSFLQTQSRSCDPPLCRCSIIGTVTVGASEVEKLAQGIH